MRRLAALLFALLLPLAARGEGEEPGRFDFYVLALSWSPSYCASVAPGRSPLQCDSGFPFGFVLHGLWPQYDRGYPSYCPFDEAGPSAATVADMLDIMPSEGLVRYQWRKHGQCAGIPAEDYFELSRRAFTSIAVPKLFSDPAGDLRLSAQEIEAAFLALNPDVSEQGLSLVCTKKGLSEVRLCLDKDLKPRTCAELERKDCRSRSVAVLPRR